ncbi:MAG: hypothetical protein M3550_18995, partial [Actinomycetota bacterium]|nr:hypothetical protein [Actinomycetota bacterium]
YEERKYVSTTWRHADDMTFATKIGYPNHQLFAKAGKAAASNTALRAVNSDIELVELPLEATFVNGANTNTVKLKKIEAKNKVNGTQGDGMLLWADCGRSASVVVGKSDRQAVYKSGGAKAVVPGSPNEMKSGIMKTWLNKERGRKLFVEANQTDADAIDDALAKGARREAELGPIAARWRVANAAGNEPLKEAISAEYSAKSDEASEAYLAYYNSRPETERRSIDRELGINWHAKPAVGQGYTTSSGGAAVPGAASTWNFHWSGVVMASDDDRDRVVIENYSVSDWDKENDKWTFETYGRRWSSQTFHERHKATGQHGQSPTTMTIEPQP